jgi:hypothetical protein
MQRSILAPAAPSAENARRTPYHGIFEGKFKNFTKTVKNCSIKPKEVRAVSAVWSMSGERCVALIGGREMPGATTARQSKGEKYGFEINWNARGAVLTLRALLAIFEKRGRMAALARLPPGIIMPSLIAHSKLNNFARVLLLPSSRRTLMTNREFYINGRWTPPTAARDLHVMLSFPPNFQTNHHMVHWQVIDPSTEEACAVISLGFDADADAAVAAAKAALPSWSSQAPAARRAYVEAILAQYSSRSPNSPPPTKHKTSNNSFAQSRRDGRRNQHRNGRSHRSSAQQSSTMPAMAYPKFLESFWQHAVATPAGSARA